ncbi:MAG TPA: HAD-IA family hydrolase [Caulobacteraceae bacterium]|jgi:phosphoglycolate phosphatase
MTQRVRHAVFDLDGTLVDSAPAITEILNAMLTDRGLEGNLSCDTVRPFVTAGGRAMVEGLVGDAWGDAETTLAEFRARYAETVTPRESLYPGAEAAIAELSRRGLVLAVFSNKPQHLCEKVLGDIGVANRFASIVGSGPGIPHKPDPTGLRLALSRSGGAPDRACYVGDTALDQETARRCGMPIVMVAWGYGEPDRHAPPPPLARRFDETPDLVCLELERAIAG